MGNEERSDFWKTFLPIAALVIVLGALGIYGITALFRGIADRQETTPAPESSRPAETTAPRPSYTSADPSMTPSIFPSDPTAESVIINRNNDPFLNRMGELEELFILGMVLDYDLDTMHEAAMQAYVEEAGGEWSSYKDAVPDYSHGEIIFPRKDSAFLDRLGEVAEMVKRDLAPDAEQIEQCEDRAFRAFVEGSGDPYSAYLTEKEWDDMMESSSGSYCGIGVQISQHIETLECTVVTVFSNSPAKEAGIKEGDIFKAVDGLDITQMSLDEIVTHVRGEEGTWIDITLYRPSTGETLVLPCTRRQVEVDTVYYEMLTDSIGYIRLTEFDDVSIQQVAHAIQDLGNQGMVKLIFDLRGNPGGLLNSVLSIADFFLPKNLMIFRMDYNDGEVYTERTRDRQMYDGDMVLLVDGNSASASEVMTGILQDYGRAVVMGTQTFGKGIVQSFYTLDDGGALKVTIAHYYSPTGRDFHGVGITPDIEAEDDIQTEEVDELLELAKEQLK